MAYDPENPPSLITQGVGGPTGLRWFALMWTDTIADVLVPGYISNATDIGMRAGDGFIYKDVNRGEWDHYDLICLEVDATGAATLAFPEVPEEALPEADTFDPNDATQYLVMYQNGRMTRIQIGLFAPNQATVASQAEAESGTDNEKRMTPLRVFQAIAGYVVALAAKATGVSADSVVISDSEASGAPKKLTLANLFAVLTGSAAKATPVGGDSVIIADSAASGAPKTTTLTNLITFLAATFVPVTSAVYTLSQKWIARNNIDVFGDYQIAGLKPDKISTDVLRIYPGVVYGPDGSVGVRNAANYDIDMSTVGMGGLDTGTPTEQYDYFVYVFRKDSDGSFGALLSHSNTYGGVAAQAGYTILRKLRFGFVYRAGWDGIPNFDAMNWPWPEVRLTDAGDAAGSFNVLNSGGSTSYADVQFNGVMPDNGRIAYVMCKVTYSTSAGTAYLRSKGISHDVPVGATDGVPHYSFLKIRVNSLRELQYKVLGGVTLSIWLLGYEMTEPS